MAREGRGNSESRPEGIERRPKACELGPYAEFVLYQDDLPLLRRFNREGIIHWLAHKKERSTGILQGIFQVQTLNKAYYSNRKPVEDRGWQRVERGTQVEGQLDRALLLGLGLGLEHSC